MNDMQKHISARMEALKQDMEQALIGNYHSYDVNVCKLRPPPRVPRSSKGLADLLIDALEVLERPGNIHTHVVRHTALRWARPLRRGGPLYYRGRRVIERKVVKDRPPVQVSL